MPTPALDEKPLTDAYTQSMVDAYSYIQKGGSQAGHIPLSEIYSYYLMFEDEMVETKRDFVYLIHRMNQPVLESIAEQHEKAKTGSK